MKARTKQQRDTRRFSAIALNAAQNGKSRKPLSCKDFRQKKKFDSFRYSRIKTIELIWCERGDLPAFFRREDAAFDGSWLRAKKSRYSPVCALVHAQPTGLCGHDSSLPDTKMKNPNILTVSFEVHPL